MATFSYKATNANGKIVESTTNASNRQEVAAQLTKSGLSPIAIRETKAKQLKGSLPTTEKISLTRYLATMLNSGLSITHSINILLEEAKHPLTRKILNDLNFGIENGQNISDILAQYPNTFDNFFITIVKAGEISGTLAETFKQIEEEVRAEHSLSQKIQGALMYPAVVFSAMLAIGLLMFFFILPQIGKVFLNLNLPLAAPTRILFEVSLAAGKRKFLIMGIGTGAFAAIITFIRTSTGKRLLLKSITPIPVIRNLIQKIDMARFCRVFSTLLKSGVPITKALEISLDSLSFPKFREKSPDIIDQVTRGQTLSIAFKENKIFPALLSQMIASGERSGTLDSTLKDLGEFYEEEVENGVKKMTQLLEPILMLMVGIGVGIMVLAVITPIYSVVSNLQSSMP